MTPEEIDAILEQSAQRFEAPAEVDAAVVQRAKEGVLPSLRAVRPLAPGGVFIAGFLAIFGTVAVASAGVAGMYGWRALTLGERIAVFAVVIAAACFAAVACSREMRPAGGRRMSGLAFMVAGVGLLVAFALLFHDYGTQKLVAQGVPCLAAGLMFAVPAASLGILLVRRGFVLNLAAAGLAVGTLAGLSGIGGLELHCPNLKASHVMLWHVGVVVASALIVRTVLARRLRRVPWRDTRCGLPG